MRCKHLLNDTSFIGSNVGKIAALRLAEFVQPDTAPLDGRFDRVGAGSVGLEPSRHEFHLAAI